MTLEWILKRKIRVLKMFTLVSDHALVISLLILIHFAEGLNLMIHWAVNAKNVLYLWL